MFGRQYGRMKVLGGETGMISNVTKILIPHAIAAT